jgi:hypothetical protein
VKASGRYSVYVEDAGGCKGTSDTVSVFVHPMPKPLILVTGSLALCEGDSVRLEADDASMPRVWSTGDTARSITVRASGIISYTATGSGGCSRSSAPVTVDVQKKPAPVISGLPEICVGGIGSYSVNDVAGHRYLWSVTNGILEFGDTTAAITVRWDTPGTGMLSVRETTTAGCFDTSRTFFVLVHPLPVAIITRNNDTLSTGAAATWQWKQDGGILPGATNRTLKIRQTGNYSVVLIDSNGCSTESAQLLVEVIVSAKATVQVGFAYPYLFHVL